MNDVYSSDFLLDLITRQKASNFRPGDQIAYNNSGYFLLGLIVERATGQSLQDYADSNFFSPLGMTQTGYLADRGQLVEQRAVGYVRKDDGAIMYHLWNFEQVGSSGLYTNLQDFAEWDRNYYTQEVGGTGFTDLLTETGTLSDGSKTYYAFGLMHGDYRGQKVIFHDGSQGAFRAQFDRYPNLQTSILVFCNTITDAWGLSREVADIVLEQHLAPAEGMSGEQTEGADSEMSADQETFNPTEVQLNAFTGYWQVPDFSLLFEIIAEDGQLFAIIEERLNVRILSENSIYIAGSDALLTFADASEGRYTTAEGVAEGLKFNAIRPGKVTNPSQYAGRYYSEELDTVLTLRAVGSELRVSDRTDFDGLAVPFGNEGSFQMSLGTMNFFHDDSGPAGFTLDLGRVNGLLFEKQR